MLDSSEIPPKAGLHKVSTLASCGVRRGRGRKYQDWRLVAPAKHLLTLFALAVMEYAVGVSKFGKNPKTLLVHQY